LGSPQNELLTTQNELLTTQNGLLATENRGMELPLQYLLEAPPNPR
jgi:hypothetical protein